MNLISLIFLIVYSVISIVMFMIDINKFWARTYVMSPSYLQRKHNTNKFSSWLLTILYYMFNPISLILIALYLLMSILVFVIGMIILFVKDRLKI